MSAPKLLVTHHSPDLDAITAVWLFKRFDAQTYAAAKVAFVNPGTTLAPAEADSFDVQLHDVVHVDTGLGEFDHHQTDRGQQYLSAAKLVFEYLCESNSELRTDKALATITSFTTDVDQFADVYWPDSDDTKYYFMIHELIRGFESQPTASDQTQLEFGMQMLDCAYSVLSHYFQAATSLDESTVFAITGGTCLALETSNDLTIKIAQKRGHTMVIKRDPKQGNIRIKVRPDSTFKLDALAEKIRTLDPNASWYYHPSGRMLINGSDKHRDLEPSALSLAKVIQLVQELYPA